MPSEKTMERWALTEHETGECIMTPHAKGQYVRVEDAIPGRCGECEYCDPLWGNPDGVVEGDSAFLCHKLGCCMTLTDFCSRFTPRPAPAPPAPREPVAYRIEIDGWVGKVRQIQRHEAEEHDKSQLETWADGAETNYIVNPTPAQVDAAVKRVMEEVMEP